MNKMLLSFLFFCITAIYITYPLFLNIGSISTGKGDEYLIAWIQTWNIHALTTNPLQIFESNIYYPYHNTLAYSETFLTSSIISFLPYMIVNEPIVTTNFTFISSLVLLGFSIFLLSFCITKNYAASILSGTLVIFSPAVLDKKVHLQILSVQWVLFSTLFFISFLKKNKLRYLVLSMFFFVIQMFNSFLPGYFLVVIFISLLCFYSYRNIHVLKSFLKKEYFITIFVTFLLLLPIIIPYYKVSKEFSFSRDIRDAIHFALQPEDILVGDKSTRLQPVLSKLQNPQMYGKNASFKVGYIGLIFMVLLIPMYFYFLKRYWSNSYIINSFITTSIFGFILSLGPALHFNRVTIHEPFIIPLPYALFYYILPGFNGFRNSSRWEILFIILAAVLIGVFLDKIMKKFSLKKKVILYALLLVAVIGEFNFPLRYESVPQKKEFPLEYHWLSSKTDKAAAVIELPIYNWNMIPFSSIELQREYYSTIHFRRMINGYSGFSPPPWQKFVYSTLKEFPSQDKVTEFKMLGITYIIIHKDEYDVLEKNKFMIDSKRIQNGTLVLKSILQNSSLKLIKQFNNTYIFEIL